jgi:phthalate 4,5-dioxygenase
MLNEEQSRDLVDTRPGKPAGELLRRYWQPIALAEEVLPQRPLPLTILHEDLVLFRGADGALGLLERGCCHRGMDLSFGRVEAGGLRCIYHGWLYAPDGHCLEQPGEPAASTFYQRTRQPSYPCREAAGAIFAYLGPGEPPAFPSLEVFSAGPEYSVAIKLLQECNYLQANEGNMDPVHQSFLHGFSAPGGAAAPQRQNESIGGTGASNLELYAANTRPLVEQQDTRFGIQAFIARETADGGTFLKIYNFVMPNLSIIPGAAGADGYGINWHVPIDDENHWKFIFTFSRSKPIDPAKLAGVRPQWEAPYRPKRNKRNRYLQDRDDMISNASGWFSGLGPCFGDHDTAAHEGQGAVQNRTKEHLAESDKIIIRIRRLMFDALDDIKQQKDPRGVVRGPAGDWGSELHVLSEFFPASEDWRRAWSTRADQRLAMAPGR